MFKKLVIGYIAIVDSLFIHRDLKTANILLKANGDHWFWVLLDDYGQKTDDTVQCGLSFLYVTLSSF